MEQRSKRRIRLSDRGFLAIGLHSLGAYVKRNYVISHGQTGFN